MTEEKVTINLEAKEPHNSSPSNAKLLILIFACIFFSFMGGCLGYRCVSTVHKVAVEEKENKVSIPADSYMPVELQYIERIESGIYIHSCSWGMAVLSIEFDENRENAILLMSLYPDRKDLSNQLHKRFECVLLKNGNLLEREDNSFTVSFDKDDHSIEFNIYDDSIISDKLLDLRKDLLRDEFHCLYLSDEKIRITHEIVLVVTKCIIEGYDIVTE